MPKYFNAWEGMVHFNLNQVAFESNLTKNPNMCKTRPKECVDNEPDGSLRRFSWPLDQFMQVMQADINAVASMVSTLFKNIGPGGGAWEQDIQGQLSGGWLYAQLGLPPTDAPWFYQLAVDSEYNACSEIEE